jgi:hypothetical protein
MVLLVVGGGMELDDGDGKQQSKRLDAPKDIESTCLPVKARQMPS